VYAHLDSQKDSVNIKELVEAAGVERERSAILNQLMARDFWS
jgi:hypothetical protein